MTESDATHRAHEQLPPLSRDHGFWGMTATQFLGAFNDNLFKQLILLLCVDFAMQNGDQQGIAQGLFALPFVLFSGFGGYLSDRLSKRTIIVLCKVAEIAVMLAGFVALLTGGLWPLFAVLFFMGTQSAFFGPSKYGILPEMIRERDLPTGNGMIQMTTFLAIIFGTAAAGYGKELFADGLWIITGICVVIAIVGTLTSLLVRRTPVAQPTLEFEFSSLAINTATRKLLWRDGPLRGVLLISSLFWFIGGLVLPAVNALGKSEMHLKDARTSLMATCMGIGIAIGCVSAGKLSKKRLRFEFVTIGAWGMAASLAAITLLGTLLAPPNSDEPQPTVAAASTSDRETIDGSSIAVASPPPESIGQLLIPRTTQETLMRLTLTGLGLFAGLFVVPLQVFMQARPPEDQKGRMIGAMNLVNWIGILLAAGFYQVCTMLFEDAGVSISWIFAITSMLLLPVAILYRPREESLD
ncbi:MAG: MFS transporter [Planctomycetaceae bacterium]|jgi:MFS family permease|nr:MFS transporter [Planctomycetaceae bacterium]MBT6155732.1 MFS transporter [Planctomycetaceae bacterium]MBT6485015.1 MFS transporter [Planctomycetaceae bacterium]MBT6497499.1 MFS transporter [Planctomycetaceae bacterium]